MKLLHVDSSILGDHSVSRTISAAIVAQLTSRIDGLVVSYRDLASAPLSHLSGAALMGRQAVDAPPAGTSSEGIAGDEATLEDFIAADIVVIGCPMYNFAVPSQLKAWIDRICVAGKTFRYTEAGAVGMAGGKRVIVAAARGGLYAPGTPEAAAEHQESYLKAVFGFLGVTDLTFIRAEGLAFGPDHRDEAIKSALHEATLLAA